MTMKPPTEIDSKRVASFSPRPCSALLRDWLDTIHVLAQEMQEQWWMSPHYRLQCASAIEEVAQCCMDYIDSTNPPKSEKETIQVGGNVTEALTLATKRAKADRYEP